MRAQGRGERAGTDVAAHQRLAVAAGAGSGGGERRAVRAGAVGVAAPPANCRVSFVSPETVAFAPVAGLWARVGWFRSLAAHYAPFYLEHVKQRIDERRMR